MKSRSTITNLTTFTQFASNVLDKRGQVDVIYTDFSKAFDKVDHSTLISKLTSYGFTSKSTMLLTSYLSTRKQFVAYNGYYSMPYIATSGVPQGSNLGPLLFLLFINDICYNLKCNCLLFADDLKIYSAIQDIDDCVKLQSDLNIIMDWCITNRLHLNTTKCKTVTYSRKHQPVVFTYSIDNISLDRCETVQDLGITFDTSLKFDVHIFKIVAKANRFFGFIVRNCKLITNISAITTLYMTYVRSQLDYASIVWSPYYKCYINEIDYVQKKFLKYLFYKSDGFYPDRGTDYKLLLNKFQICSLHDRRQHNSVIFLYKLLHGKIDCSDLLSQLLFLVPRQNSRSTNLFFCERAHSNLLLKSPVRVMCSNVNTICSKCGAFDIFNCSFNELKNILKEYL